MGRKQVIVAGLALVIGVGALLILRPAFKARTPQPTGREASLPSPTGQETPGEKAQPSQEEKGQALSFASASWIMEQQRIDAGGLTKETTTSKVWIKGDKKRVETFRTLGAWSGTALQPTSILFSDGEYEYAYYPAERRMLRIPRALSLESLSKRWVRQRSEEKVGREVVDGKPCETYRLVSDVKVAGLATVKMEVHECRWRGLVLKSVSRPLGSSTGDTYITHLRDVRLNVPVPDEKFILPTGVRVEDLDIPPEALE